METLQEQPLPSQSSILYFQAAPQWKSRSEWSRKSITLWHYHPQKHSFFLFLVCHLKFFNIHFILRELLLRTISERGSKSEIGFEKFIYVGVGTPFLLQQKVDAIYLCKTKRKGREDKRETQSSRRRDIKHTRKSRKTWTLMGHHGLMGQFSHLKDCKFKSCLLRIIILHPPSPAFSETPFILQHLLLTHNSYTACSPASVSHLALCSSHLFRSQHYKDAHCVTLAVLARLPRASKWDSIAPSR